MRGVDRARPRLSPGHGDPDTTHTPLASHHVATAGPTVSVVVCAYTHARSALVLEALASLRTQLRPPEEVIVVVDHNPGLLSWVAEQAPEVRCAPNAHSTGLSGARNTGIAMARGDVVAFLDDDAVADPDWIERLATTYDAPSVLGVGGHVSARWEGRPPAWFPHEFAWVVGCSYLGMPESRSPVRNLIGCNMSFRRDVLATIGGFDPDLGRTSDRPLGCEETELCIRASRSFPGGLIIYEPRARVSHHVPRSRGQMRYFRSRCYAEGLSKARVARKAGRRDGLASERAHALRVLPRGVLRELRHALRAHEPGGLGRSASIVAGLTLTAAGYAVGTLLPR